MLEIEQKYAHADFARLERRLKEWGAAFGEAHEEADHYFNAPDRDFARTDEAFRLRRVGLENFLTYKGPKQKADVKVRIELEIAIQPGDAAAADMTRLLTHLGYRFVAVVQKRRRTAALRARRLRVHALPGRRGGPGPFRRGRGAGAGGSPGGCGAGGGGAGGGPGVERGGTAFLPRPGAGGEGRGGGPVKSVVVSTGGPLRQAVAEARRAGKTIGLVPTMGALHAGHVSLIDAARAADGFVVVSIFVNPTQFGPKEDLSRYPRPLRARPGDVRLRRRGPRLHAGRRDDVSVRLPHFRGGKGTLGYPRRGVAPGHFRGVATVVLKLFNLVQPDRAYFGQKDAQQVRIIQQIAHDLNVPVKVVVRPTVRESDRLALSSRNQYLDPDQRRKAVALNEALEAAEAEFRAGERDPTVIEHTMAQRIAVAPGAANGLRRGGGCGHAGAGDAARGMILLALAVRFAQRG